jgi:hypothetical protein
MLFGAAMNGPAMHFSTSKGSCPRSLAKKLLLTQAFFSAVSISSFYVFSSFIDHKNA